MPPTPLRQIYSKICVCLERPRAVRLSATIAKEVSRCRDNFSDCSAMGDPRPAEGGRWIPRPPWILTDVIYLLHGHLLFPVHLSPSCSVRAPVSTSSKHTHAHTHKQGGIRQRRRHKLDRDGFLNDVSGLTADDYDKKQFPSQFQVTFPSSVCPIYLCFFFKPFAFYFTLKKRQIWIPHSLAFVSPSQRMFPVIYQRLLSENSWYFSLSTPHSKPVCTDFPHHPSDHSLTETLQQNEILPRYIVLYCYIKSVTSPLHE